jgi:ERCC4-type nuclease
MKLNLQLVLDHRERDLIEQIKATDKDIEILIENLELGDIVIRDENKNDLVIYERKSISDLMSSIKDGRYSEQSYRLNGLPNHNHNIIYLIEGTVSKSSKDRQTIFSALFSINYYKGFSVMRSTSIEETAYIICNAFSKIKKEGEKGKNAFYMNKAEINNSGITDVVDTITDGGMINTISYSSVIKSKKNANVTPSNFGEIALCQIPSVNTVSAIAIMKEFKTLSNLINSIKENSNCLEGIKYETDKKQTRKISKTVIKNIVEYLAAVS